MAEIIEELSTLANPNKEKEEKVYQKFRSFLKNKLAEVKQGQHTIRFFLEISFFDGYILLEQIEKFTDRIVEEFDCVSDISFIVGSIDVSFNVRLKN